MESGPGQPPGLPPGCEDGEVVSDASTFVPSTDGMECELPSVYCVSADSPACTSPASD